MIGDRVYCPPPVYSGHGLHLTCTQLEWIHPRTHQKMSVTTPPAKKMKRVITSSFEMLDPSEHLPLFRSEDMTLTVPYLHIVLLNARY